MLTSCEIECYGEYIDELSSIGGLGESNDDLVKYALEDVNAILKAGLHRLDVSTLQSNMVKYIIDNMIRNGEDVSDYALEVANRTAAWFMINVLGTMMVMTDTFYAYQIDVDETNVYERNYTEFTCQIRLDIYQAYEIDEDSTVDAARLVNAIFQMYSISGKECVEVRREIQAVFRAH